MKNIAKTLMATMLSAPALCFAGDLSYTYVQGGYTSVTVDVGNTEIDSDGWYAGGSFLVAPNVFLFGSYSELASDTSAITLDTTSYNVGLGVRAPITDYVDFNVAAAWVNVENEYTGIFINSSGESDGYSVSAGFRALLGEHLEINTGYNYADVEDETGSFDVGGLLHITKLISVTAAYRFGEAEAWTAGARLNF